MSEWFRGPSLLSAPSSVDREKRIIYGVSLVTKGPASGHELEFDDTSIDQTHEHAATAPGGLKARFTHPNESNDGLGTYLGRYHNARREGDKVLADLHFGRMASHSPDGDLAEYVMGLAEEDPQSFGLSIVAKIKREYRLDSSGKPLCDADGRQLDPVARIQRLHAADVVDSPAANVGLFDDRSFGSPATAVTRVLDRAFFSSDPQTLREKAGAFLDNYFSQKGIPMPNAIEDKPLGKLQAESVAAEGLSAEHHAEVVAKVVEERLRKDGERRNQIRSECKRFGLGVSFAESLCDENVSIELARGKILDELARISEEKSKGTGFVPGDALEFSSAGQDRLSEAVGTALNMQALRGFSSETIEKQCPSKDRAQGWEDFRHASFLDVAKVMLQASGANLRGLPPAQIAKAALGFHNQVGVKLSGSPAYHVTGSFPYLLMNSIHKSVLGGYDETPVTWNRVFTQGDSVSDFKNIDRVRMSEAANLKIWPENTRIEQAFFSDEKETYGVESYGAMVTISYRAIVNDDKSVFSRIPRKMGRAAARTVNALVWSIITSNPTMSDGQALFSAVAGNRLQNNIDSAATLSITTLSTGAALMMKQKGLNQRDGTISESILGLRPAYCVVPAELDRLAKQLLFSQFDPSTNLPGGVYNPYAQGEERIVPITEPLLSDNSATAYYLFASQMAADIVELTFLQGQEQPIIEVAEDWDNMGLKWKAVQTMGAKAVGWRGAVKNAGA